MAKMDDGWRQTDRQTVQNTIMVSVNKQHFIS